MAVSLTFRQRPELVSAIIDPAAKLRRLGRRNVVALVSGVHKQERVPGKFDLHQPSAYLWHDREPQPFIGQLHGIPALEFHRIRLARRMNRQTCREPCGLQSDKGYDDQRQWLSKDTGTHLPRRGPPWQSGWEQEPGRNSLSAEDSVSDPVS